METEHSSLETFGDTQDGARFAEEFADHSLTVRASVQTLETFTGDGTLFTGDIW